MLSTCLYFFFFFFLKRRRHHTIFDCDWISGVCYSNLVLLARGLEQHPMGLERRHEPEDHIVEDSPGREAGVAREPVCEHRGGQMPTDLRRVDARRDEHDGLGAMEHVVRFLGGLEAPGVRELRVELTVAVQGPQVLRARDDQRDERDAEGAVSQLAVPHAIAHRSERLVVAEQCRPVGELSVVARLEPEDRPRCRYPWGGDRRRAASRRRRPARLLRRRKRSRRGGERGGEQEQQQAEHGGRRTYRRPARRRYGSLCSSTRRFFARPAAVGFGAM